MTKYFILIILTSSVFLTSKAFAQKKTEISTEKKAVIAELLTLMKAEAQTKEIMQAMFAQMESMYPDVIESILNKETELTAAQKEQVKKEIIEKDRNFNQRFNEKFIKMINFEEYMNEVFYPLYDKFFTTAEIVDLIAFYKTPTGQKFIAATPQLSGESMKLAQEYLLPRIDNLIKEITNEDSNRIKSNKNPPAPRKKQN